MQRPPQNFWYWIGGLLLVLSAALRVTFYPVITSDYTYFLSRWFVTLHTSPGLSAFTYPFSDYAPLYLYFIKVLTYIPAPSLYSIKTLSVVFDVLVAYAAAYLIVGHTKPATYSKPFLFFIFALMFSIPTEIINGSLWGQSDSVYALGIILSLYYILKDKPLGAVLWFSFAFCIKLQAIFFLPVLIGYCLRKERSAGYLVFIPLVYFASVIPARLGGGALTDLLLVYAKESQEYSALSVSAQNVFSLFSGNSLPAAGQHILFLAGMVAGVLVSAGIIAVMYFNKGMTARATVFVSLLCTLLVPYVLPRMHERYFYLADIISVIYALYSPSSWYFPVLVVGASLISYVPYLTQLPQLSQVHVNLMIPSLMVLAAIIIILIQSYKVVVTAERVVS